MTRLFQRASSSGSRVAQCVLTSRLRAGLEEVELDPSGSIGGYPIPPGLYEHLSRARIPVAIVFFVLAGLQLFRAVVSGVVKERLQRYRQLDRSTSSLLALPIHSYLCQVLALPQPTCRSFWRGRLSLSELHMVRCGTTGRAPYRKQSIRATSTTLQLLTRPVLTTSTGI